MRPPSGAILALTGQRMRVMHEPGIADLARAILKETIAVGRAEGATMVPLLAAISKAAKKD